MVFFDRAAGGKSGGASVNCGAVDCEGLHPVEVKGRSGVAVGGDGQVSRLLGEGGGVLGMSFCLSHRELDYIRQRETRMALRILRQ